MVDEGLAGHIPQRRNIVQEDRLLILYCHHVVLAHPELYVPLGRVVFHEVA